MSSRKQLLVIAAISFDLFASAQAADLPRRIGECVDTTIKAVETRLVDGQTNKPVPGSGSAVSFTNGGYQVSYETVPAIERSKAGDPRACASSSFPAIVRKATFAAVNTKQPICVHASPGDCPTRSTGAAGREHLLSQAAPATPESPDFSTTVSRVHC